VGDGKPVITENSTLRGEIAVEVAGDWLVILGF
jgi:hypothetical protein